MELDILREESSANRNYLVCDLSNREDIIAFELNMLANNEKIVRFLPVTKIVRDDEIVLRYDITGLISLIEYIQISLSKDQIWKVLTDMCKIAEQAAEYMLREEGIYCNLSKMYVNPGTGRVYAAYLPFENTEDLGNISYLQRIRNVMNQIMPDQNESTKYWLQWRDICQKEEIRSASALYNALQMWEEQQEQEQAIAKQRKEKKMQGIGFSQNNRMEASEIISGENLIAVHNSMENLNIPNPAMSESPGGRKNKKESGGFWNKNKKEKESVKVQNINKAGIPAGKGNRAVSDGGGQAPPEITESNSQEKNNKKKYSLFGKKKENVPKISAATENIVKTSSSESRTGARSEIDENNHTIMANNTAENIAYQRVMNSLQKRELSRPRAWIMQVRNMHREEIKMDSFIIGRSAYNTDLSIQDNLEIGRQHAEIQFLNGGYFLIDKGSVNGTFLNGMKLNPGMPVRLNSKDRIILSNENSGEVLIFETQESFV